MKTITYNLLIFVFAVSIVSGQHQKKSDDEAAVRGNVDQMVKGWNTKSGAEFAKPFARDADYVVINGMHLKGRAANAEGHQRIFDTIYKNSTLAYAVEQIRFLRPDVAIVHVRAELKATLENLAETGNARITMIMTKNKDRWEIAAFQNTAIATGEQPKSQ